MRAHHPLFLLVPTLLACTATVDGGPSSSTTGPPTPEQKPPVNDPPPHEVPACPDHAEATFAELTAMLESGLQQNGVPGGAIAIVCGGKLAHARGVGHKHMSSNEPVTEDTRFQWASTTKMFTAALALVLAENGTVDLDKPVSTWVPYLAYPELTLHHLLSHTGGYPTEWAHYPSDDLEPVVQANASAALWAPPGAVHFYSNPGFSVAGLVLEKADATPFGALVERRIFAQAGMQTTFDVAEVMAGDFAHGHSTYYGPVEAIPPNGAYLHTGWYGPMGGAWGSVRDLALWAEVHMSAGGGVLSPSSLEALKTAHTKTGIPGQRYGYGLFIDESMSPTVISHSGSTVGYLADWEIVPEAGFGVFVLVNGDWWWPGEPVYQAIERFVGAGPGTVDSVGTWNDYVGTYVDPNELGTVVIEVDNGSLSARFVDANVVSPLMPYVGDVYFASYPPAGGDIDITFWRDSDQAPASYLVSLWGVAARGAP